MAKKEADLIKVDWARCLSGGGYRAVRPEISKYPQLSEIMISINMVQNNDRY